MVSEGPSSTSAPWRPSHNPWLITVAVLLATFMEVLDTSIANVSLPHIAGNLSATTEESTWVLTSYLVANAIILPAAGWLSRFFGRKRYLTFSVLLFTGASVLCGTAHSLSFLIFARILQGLGGGGLQPLSQAILLESFHPKDRGAAMAAYGMGIVVAPIIGPTLGGWITDNYSWRWIFLINIPIGVIGLLMQQAFVEDPPHLKGDKTINVDYIGFGLMAVWIGWLQIVLDKGQQSDWFEAPWLRWSTLAIIVTVVAFVWWELRSKDPIVNLRLFKNRNFATASVLMGLIGAVLYGSTVLLPIFTQMLLGYTAYLSGLTLTPRGIGSFLSMVIVGRLIRKLDPRLLTFMGFVGLAVSSWYLSHLTLNIKMESIGWPLVFNGLSMGFIFVPMTTLSVATLKDEQIYQSTGLYALMRNTGGSIGISILVTLQARWAQVHQAALVPHLTTSNPNMTEQWKALQHSLLSSGLSTFQSAAGATGMLYRTLIRQAQLLAFMDCFRWMAVVCVLCFPLILLFRRGHTHKEAVLLE